MKSLSMTIQMKYTEQYFSVTPFITLHKVVPTFESADESLSIAIQMKASEQCFPVVLFTTLQKVALKFEFVVGETIE